MAFWRKNPVTGQSEPVDDARSLSDIEFKPEQLEAKITENFTSALEKFRAEQAEANKPLQEMAAAIMAERNERTAKAQREAQAKERQESQVTSEDYLLDPEGATKRAMQPLARATMVLAAKEAKREALGDKEYYHGDIKSKVDAMIAQQPLESQTRADVIENCYKLVMFDHMDAVRDGKIKARNTSAVFEGGSTGAHGGKDAGDSTEALSAEEKQVAKLMGLSEKEWSDSKKELSYV